MTRCACCAPPPEVLTRQPTRAGRLRWRRRPPRRAHPTRFCAPCCWRMTAPPEASCTRSLYRFAFGAAALPAAVRVVTHAAPVGCYPPGHPPSVLDLARVPRAPGDADLQEPPWPLVVPPFGRRRRARGFGPLAFAPPPFSTLTADTMGLDLFDPATCVPSAARLKLAASIPAAAAPSRLAHCTATPRRSAGGTAMRAGDPPGWQLGAGLSPGSDGIVGQMCLSGLTRPLAHRLPTACRAPRRSSPAPP